MRKHFVLLILSLLLLGVVPALAQSRPFETLDQSRSRHSAQNYDTYQQHGNQAPLGGYPEKFGDPAPPGTDRPGLYPSHNSPFASPSRLPGPFHTNDD